jgi:hypothetical protein
MCGGCVDCHGDLHRLPGGGGGERRTGARADLAVALGLDWGVKTLLTGTVGKLAVTPTGSRVVTDGRMLRFAATGVSAKLHRLRGHRQTIATRRDHDARLLDGLPEYAPDRVVVQAKHAILAAEHQRICDRIRRLNYALAWAAARWAVDQASALGASVIYLEDLATLEARGRRTGNARLPRSSGWGTSARPPRGHTRPEQLNYSCRRSRSSDASQTRQLTVR